MMTNFGAPPALFEDAPFWEQEAQKSEQSTAAAAIIETHIVKFLFCIQHLRRAAFASPRCVSDVSEARCGDRRV